MNRQRAHELLSRMENRNVGVIGDLMLDRYVRGSATRISPEAPVPVVRVTSQHATLGGAANVMRNLAALGANARAFGVLGDDPPGQELLKLARQAGINTEDILTDYGRRTTVKTRVIAEHQQVVRIDDEMDAPLAAALHDQLAAAVMRAVTGGELQALIIEDYNKGVLSQSLVDVFLPPCLARGLTVTLDPHPGNVWTGRGLTLMTPNRQEACALAGEYYRPTVLPLERDEVLTRVGCKLRQTWAPRLLLVTLGAGGMALFEGDAPPRHIPTQAREVYDVCGAGDTVISVFTLALAAGAGSEEAAIIANHAAGIVVGKLGTAVATREELLASFPEA